MRKKKKLNRRRLRLYQELRANLPDEDGKKWGRPKRDFTALEPWAWWNESRHHHKWQRSWKFKRDTQYREHGKRGRRWEYKTDDWWVVWRMREYFEDHDIPYSVQKETESRQYTWWQKTERKVLKQVPVFGRDGRQRGFRDVYYEDILPEPIPHTRIRTEVKEYIVSYWTPARVWWEKILEAP